MIPDTDYEVVNQVPMTTYVNETLGAKCHLVHTKPEWDALFGLLMTKKKVAVDTETTGFEYFLPGKHIVGFSLGWGETNFYVATRHVDSELGGKQIEQIPMEYMKEDLQKFFAQTDVTTIYFNAKFDQHFFLKEGIKDKTNFKDAALYWALYDENSPGKLKVISSGWKDLLGRWHEGVVHKDAAVDEKKISAWRGAEARERRKALTEAVKKRAAEMADELKYQALKVNDRKKLARRELEHTHKWSGLIGKSDVHYGYVPIPMMAEYAGLDTFLTWKVFHHCVENIKWNQKLVDLIKIEHELSATLSDIEEVGALIDRTYLIETSKRLGEEIEALREEVKESLGISNLNSNIQIAGALLDRGVRLVERTEGSKGCSECVENTCRKHFKVDAKVLEKLATQHPIIQKLLDYKAKVKIKGTYVDSILAKLTVHDILHCSFRQNVSTGRMSSSDPNLQNIPRKDDTIRRAFIVPEDYVLVLADYSQVEVRLTAHFSEDPALLEAYDKGQDIHLKTMCAMFRYDYDYAREVMTTTDKNDPMHKKLSALRSIAKVLNFGVIYGVSPLGLSSQVPRPESMSHYTQSEWIKECESFIDAYLYGYLGVKKMINRYGRQAKRTLEITNSFGRVRHLPWAQARKLAKDYSLGWMESKAERQAVNYAIQGEAADMFKLAVVRTHKVLQGHKSKIVNLVHDEIQMYIHKDEFYLLKDVKRVMEDFSYRVPIIADFEYTTTNWAEKREIAA